MKKIPLSDNEWIDYQNKVLIIKEDSNNGNEAHFQCDGTMCKQACVKGFIFQEFETKSKWFNPNWWYKKTSWGKDYPNKILFQTRTNSPKGNFLGKTMREFNKFWKEAEELADKKGRPVEKILKAILKEVKSKTNIDFQLDFDELQYGESWYEAYIWLKYDGQLYLLTWQNCD